MISSSFSPLFAPRLWSRRISLLVFSCVLAGAVFAQADANAGANGNGNQRGRRGQNGANGNGPGGGRGNFDPAQMQQQMMDRMREQFGVTDDAEWKVITDRITTITELRRAAGGGGLGGGRGGFGGLGGGGGRGGGRGANANPEQEALRQAVADKLPDAEIKSRLARLREVRKANEEKLTKAQEDLRALLDVRQEAAAVMLGLLP